MLENEDGPTSYVAVLRDATERKAAELVLQEALARMEQMAITDGLTGLANRSQLDEFAGREWRRCARSRQPFSVLMLDADCFKQLNDLYGHAAGDRCLRAIADQMNRVARRPGDLAARYGGEEFVLLMPATESAGAEHVASRLRRLVEELGFEHKGNAAASVMTVSIGVATAWPAQQSPKYRSVEALLSGADAALYRAKEKGRNQVVCAD